MNNYVTLHNKVKTETNVSMSRSRSSCIEASFPFRQCDSELHSQSLYEFQSHKEIDHDC